MAGRPCCARVARKWSMWPGESADSLYRMPPKQNQRGSERAERTERAEGGLGTDWDRGK